MRQDNAPKSPKEGAGDTLIKAGAFSYIDAMAALADLRSEVQDRCKAVMCSNLKQLGHALGHEFSKNAVWVWPGKPTAGISTMWPFLYSGLTPMDEVWFDLGLYWEYGEDEKVTLFAFGALEIFDEALRKRVLEGLKKSPGVGPMKRNYISIREAIPEDAPLSFQDKLGSIAARWVKELESAGGLSSLIEARPRLPAVKKT
jgi:hypothetical protein